MDIGVFIPIGNNGWLISEAAPQYMPSFDLNRELVQRAEGYGVDFALSMIKLRGFGGKTEFWDHNLESFTLMAGLAAVTSSIRLYATAATLVMPPAIVARIAADDAHGIAHFQGGANLLARIAALHAFDATTSAARITAPVLVAASRDDVLVPWTASERMAQALPDAELWVVPEGGHGFSVVDPAPFNAKLLAFLTRREAATAR